MADRNPHDSLNEFERLARLATRETVPAVDVTAGVFRRLRVREISIDRPLLVMAFGAALTAIIMALLSYPILQDMMDPLETFMETASASLL